MNDLNDSNLNDDMRRFVFRVVFRIVRDEDVASDVTQDALLAAYRYRDQFRGESAYKTWLYRIAVTTALQFLRKRRRAREDLVADLDSRGLVDPQPTPDQVVQAHELADRVHVALAAIDPKHAEPFVLRALDWSEVEIARRMRISVANVKVRAHRTRQRIRVALAA
jgi:RNA polymerase sigma-70 factor (ECF subfamily)